MKRAEIKVGTDYAVYLGWGKAPSRPEMTELRQTVQAPYHQIESGVPAGGRHSEDDIRRNAVRGKVEEIGCERWHRSGAWSRYYSKESDGVLVKLAKPVKASGGTMVTHVVVTAKHIVKTWAEFDAEGRAEKEAVKRHKREKAERIAAAKVEYAALEERLTNLGLVRGPDYDEGDFDYTFYDDGSYTKFEISWQGQQKLIEMAEARS